MRIKENVQVYSFILYEFQILGNFKEEREEGKSRGEYIDELKGDLSASYDYNEEMIDIIFDLFPPNEVKIIKKRIFQKL